MCVCVMGARVLYIKFTSGLGYCVDHHCGVASGADSLEGLGGKLFGKLCEAFCGKSSARRGAGRSGSDLNWDLFGDSAREAGNWPQGQKVRSHPSKGEKYYIYKHFSAAESVLRNAGTRSYTALREAGYNAGECGKNAALLWQLRMEVGPATLMKEMSDLT